MLKLLSAFIPLSLPLCHSENHCAKNIMIHDPFIAFMILITGIPELTGKRFRFATYDTKLTIAVLEEYLIKPELIAQAEEKNRMEGVNIKIHRYKLNGIMQKAGGLFSHSSDRHLILEGNYKTVTLGELTENTGLGKKTDMPEFEFHYQES